VQNWTAIYTSDFTFGIFSKDFKELLQPTNTYAYFEEANKQKYVAVGPQNNPYCKITFKTEDYEPYRYREDVVINNDVAFWTTFITGNFEVYTKELITGLLNNQTKINTARIELKGIDYQ